MEYFCICKESPNIPKVTTPGLCAASYCFDQLSSHSVGSLKRLRSLQFPLTPIPPSPFPINLPFSSMAVFFSSMAVFFSTYNNMPYSYPEPRANASLIDLIGSQERAARTHSRFHLQFGKAISDANNILDMEALVVMS